MQQRTMRAAIGGTFSGQEHTRRLEAQLLREFADVPEAFVRRAVADAMATYEGSPVTSFIPILSARAAKARLASFRSRFGNT